MWEVYLGVTGDCNLNCRYCYVKDLRRVTKGHPLSVCSYAIEDVLSLLDTLTLSNEATLLYFYGGEPTLNPELLDQWSAEVKAKHPAVSLVLHTNGLLLDQLSDQFLARLEYILLSVNMESHISYGTRDFYVTTVRENLAHLKDVSDLPVILRLTYTVESRFLETVFLFDDVVDAVFWQVVSGQDDQKESTLRNYGLDMSLLAEKWAGQLTKPRNPQLLPFDYALLVDAGIAVPSRESIPCGFGRSLLFVDLDGTIYACPEMMRDPRGRVGHIKTGYDLSTIVNLTASIDTKCQGCPVFDYCRGRCAFMHMTVPSESRDRMCEATRSTYATILRHKQQLGMEAHRAYLARIRSPARLRLMNLVECVP